MNREHLITEFFDRLDSAIEVDVEAEGGRNFAVTANLDRGEARTALERLVADLRDFAPKEPTHKILKGK